MIPLIVPLLACAPADAGNKWGKRPPPPDTCGLAQHAHLVGEHRDVLDGMDLPERTRIIGPRQMVTMDHLPDRLNVLVDDNGTILRFTCG